MTEHDWTTDVAPYVLGALHVADRTAFETHLRGCSPCRAEVHEVAALPTLLDQVPADLVAGLAADLGLTGVGARVVQEPPAVLLVDLLRLARQEERGRVRRRLVVGALAVAAVLALVLALPGGPVLWHAADRAPEASVEAFTLSQVVESPVTAEVSFEAMAWGTRVGLTCRYADVAVDDRYTPPGAAAPGYALVLLSADGATQDVATWLAVPGGEVTLPASTLLHRAEIVGVELRDLDGTVLLSATV